MDEGPIPERLDSPEALEAGLREIGAGLDALHFAHVAPRIPSPGAFVPAAPEKSGRRGVGTPGQVTGGGGVEPDLRG